MNMPAALAAIHPHATIRSAVVSSITVRPSHFPSKLLHYGMRAPGRKDAGRALLPRRMARAETRPIPLARRAQRTISCSLPARDLAEIVDER